MANVARGGEPLPVAVDTDKNNKNQKKDKSQKNTKAPKEKRGMTPLRAALIVLLLLLLLLTAAATLLFFNVADSRNIALSFLQMGAHPYQNQLDELTDLQEKVRAESVALSEARREMDTKEADIAKRERDIATREAALAQRTSDVNERVREMDETQTRLARFVEIYQNLSAPAAAKILEEMNDVDEIVQILTAMEPELVSQILASMDTEFAARISFRMLDS